MLLFLQAKPILKQVFFSLHFCISKFLLVQFDEVLLKTRDEFLNLLKGMTLIDKVSLHVWLHFNLLMRCYIRPLHFGQSAIVNLRCVHDDSTFYVIIFSEINSRTFLQMDRLCFSRCLWLKWTG